MVKKAVIMISAILMAATALAGEKPEYALYLPGVKSVGVILCHGRNKYPDWKVVGPLRRGLNARNGYHTLSLQMPGDGDWAAAQWNVAIETKAPELIEQAVDFLSARDVTKIFLIGHSMGGRMGSWYVQHNNHQRAIAGFVGIGMWIDNDGPLNNAKDLPAMAVEVMIPVLDVYGKRDAKDVRAAKQRATAADFHDDYTFVALDADHRMERDGAFATELVPTVGDWISERE